MSASQGKFNRVILQRCDEAFPSARKVSTNLGAMLKSELVDTSFKVYKIQKIKALLQLHIYRKLCIRSRGYYFFQVVAGAASNQGRLSSRKCQKSALK